MVDAITNAAISGFVNAETRVAVAANNIVNTNTQGFTPAAVKSTQNASGSVDTQVVQVQQPLTAAQLEDLQTKQFITTAIAVYDAKASAIVLRIQNNLNRQLFDIQA